MTGMVISIFGGFTAATIFHTSTNTFFLKCPFSSSSKRSKIKYFRPHYSVFGLFSPVHTKWFTYENAHFLICFHRSSNTNTTERLIETKSLWGFLRHRFKKPLRYNLSTLETERFKTVWFSKSSTKKHQHLWLIRHDHYLATIALIKEL